MMTAKPAGQTEELQDRVLKERDNGNIVFWGLPGQLMTARLDEFISQPAEGILYDLNRLEEISLSFLDDPKWINDFAVALTIRKLKAELEQRKAAAMQAGQSLNPAPSQEGHAAGPAPAAAPHPETPDCGYDRNGSVSAGHYVCLCGWEDATAPATESAACSKRICTYCGGTDFYKGPEGGLAINVLCANPQCRHWFNDLWPFGFEDLNRVEPEAAPYGEKEPLHGKDAYQLSDGALEPAGGMPEEPLFIAIVRRDDRKSSAEARLLDYADALRAHAEQLQERVRELEEAEEHWRKKSDAYFLDVQRAEARLREAEKDAEPGNQVIDFDCVSCGIHVPRFNHRYAPVCLKCVATYHFEHKVSMIDAHRALRDAALATQGEEEKG